MLTVCWDTYNNSLLTNFLPENTDKTTICSLELDAEKVKQFRDAIDNSYWFEFFIGMSIKISLFMVLLEMLMVFSYDCKFVTYSSPAFLFDNVSICPALTNDNTDGLPLYGMILAFLSNSIICYPFILFKFYCPE